LIIIPHPAPLSQSSYSAVELMPDNDTVLMLDQRRLPNDVIYEHLGTVAEVERGIVEMHVRGAPAIGIAAAYGMVLAARAAGSLRELRLRGEQLSAARPTAVNLRWAVEQMLAYAEQNWVESASERVLCLAEKARALHAADVAANRRMGRFGAENVPEEAVIMTLCNAGALATGGYGTALGVVRAARELGKKVRVLACETRPWLQGARLTAWELYQDGIPVEIIPDNAAASILGRGEVSLCVVGADRIARNGDVANKIGTYALSIAARWHNVPFYVAAPLSTVDLQTESGSDIKIEQRSSDEVTRIGAERVAPAGVSARNPAFDVTPAANVSALLTEAGVARPVNLANLEELTTRSSGA
jgi:methylthioribose-1-phosphate isomerase